MISEVLSKRKERLNRLHNIRKQNMGALVVTCPKCKEESEKQLVKMRGKVCPQCNYHFPMTPVERIKFLDQEKSFREIDEDLTTSDPLSFPGYKKKLEEMRDKTKHRDGIVCGTMKLQGISVAVGVMDSRFLMGSMGTVVGEKICRLTELAAKKKVPLILFCASGGARMQEGLFSLMQMAKTAAAIERFQKAGGCYISVLTHPTTGGVSASFANLGDIIIAEPEALIGFAGPRVIEQTIGQQLPEGFQRAEFLEEHGMIDRVVNREELLAFLTSVVKIHTDKNTRS